MSKLIFWNCAFVLLFIPALSVLSAEPAPAAKTAASWAAPTDGAQAPAATAGTVRTTARGDVTITTASGDTIQLSRRDRRAMGLTRLEVRRTVREMRADGFTGDREEAAEELQDRLIEKHPDAWEKCAINNGVMSTTVDGAVQFDFEGFLAFLEAFLPILLQLLAIFGLGI